MSEREKTVESPSLETAVFIDGIDFNVPSSPGAFHSQYSPAPSSPIFPVFPPNLPVDDMPLASTSKALPRRTIRESPGRPSKTAWKKRNIS